MKSCLLVLAFLVPSLAFAGSPVSSPLNDGTVPVAQINGTLPVNKGGTGVTTSTGTGANVLGTNPTISGATITNSDWNAGGAQTGQVASTLGITNQAGTITTANTTYCMPYLNFNTLTGVTKLVQRITTAGTASNVKLGVATLSGTTATMISDLNPTGVPTTASSTNIQGTISPLNIKGGQFYLLCAIGAGTVMPLSPAVSNASGSLMGLTGGGTSDFSGTFYSGFTSASNTYAGGFSATFPVTKVSSTTIPIIGFLVP